MGGEMVAIGCLVRAHGIQGELLFLPWLEVEGALLPGLELTLDDTEGPGKKGFVPPRGPPPAFPVGEAGETPGHMDSPHGGLLGPQRRRGPGRGPGSDTQGSTSPSSFGRILVEDLLGLQVIDEAGEFLGMIVEIFPTGSNEVLVMEEKGGEEILLPAIREVIREVDLERGFLRVRMMEGLRGPAEGKNDL